MKKILIVGATSTIAEHCARLWVTHASSGANLVLVGRHAARLEQIAQDLRVRSPASRIQVLESGFVTPEEIQGGVNAAVTLLGQIDLALIAHGSLPDQTECESRLEKVQEAITVNALSPVLFAEAIAAVLNRQGGGTLAVIGSVAGDRGRKSNYVYGAAKALVATYLQGLQHRFAGTPVRITLIKPGPTDTPMTSHLKSSGASLADPAAVAALIVAGMEAGKAVVYAPVKWWLIMSIIRHLPARIFNRLNI